MAVLSEARLRQLLRALKGLRLGVVGDFFLDAYYDCDPALDEKSLETGRTCYQVVRTRRQAGAAGTVAANLKALGVGQVEAVGFCGDDGEGYELRRAMAGLGLGMEGFTCWPGRFTPTYGKPCYVDARRPGRPVVEELERLDLKNRGPTPPALQRRLLEYLEAHLADWDGVLILDQANESGCGAVTAQVRRWLIAQARRRPGQVFLADSRERIGLFRHVVIKPNQFEAAGALGLPRRRLSVPTARTHAVALSRATRRPVFLTLAERGMVTAIDGTSEHVPAFSVSGPTDPVGAGDSSSAGIAACLSAGASLAEAAAVANLVASITIQQLGTTGTARPAQILARFREVSGRAA